MSVKSVYNFVPAPKEDEVFKPDWANQVSHDIPFSDGESGEIELKIIAKTPVFIRNGYARENMDNEFSNAIINGLKKYFIPATSLKGMFRNVLEVMSFSRLKQISDDRYSFRDLTKNSLYMRSYKSNDVKCGWLKEDENGDWYIEDCDEPIKISHEEIDNIFGANFKDLFKYEKDKKLKAKFKSAKNKYYLLKDKTGNLLNKVEIGSLKGTLVFTGQSSLRDDEKQSGKKHEFIFPESNGNKIKIDDKQKRDFKFIYLDHDKNSISKEWEFWREKLENEGKVPVFFNRASNSKVKHFGLAFMYKLPFEHSIHETLPYSSYNKREKDLSELLFGFTDNNAKSLKGRIFISHAFSNNAIPIDNRKEILAGPKASYYPYYLKQTRNGNPYITYMDKNSELRGFKRYPIQKGIQHGNYEDKQLRNEKVFSDFIPLKEGTTFECKVRFHNLRKVEIGALLSAITFHNCSGKSFHSLGGAKPFGYGQVSVEIAGNPRFLQYDIEDYLFEFEKLMGAEKWTNSDQIQELLSMAQYSDSSLAYPEKPKTFVDYKNENEYLESYSKVIEKKPTIHSVIKTKEFEDKIENEGFEFNNESFKKIKTQIKELGFGVVPGKLHPALIEAIQNVYENHRESKRILGRKEFNQQYEWHTTITNWLGANKAKELYKTLTEKDV